MIPPEAGVALGDSCRLWSRWDMIKQDIWKFLRAGMKMKDFQTLFDLLDKSDNAAVGIAPTFRGLKIEDMPHHKQDELRKFLAELMELCEELGLKVSQTLLFSTQYDLPKTSREFGLILLAIRREISEKLFLYVPVDRAGFFEKDDILSEKTKEEFSTAYKELKEAGSCYAAERYTASVFHSMRAAEIGLRALGEDLGVSFPDKSIELAEWQHIIEQAESKIKEKVNRRAATEDDATARDADRKFYSQVASQFRYFKDGWRIRAAHARENYTGSQALSVMTHTIDFFEELATRLSEPL